MMTDDASVAPAGAPAPASASTLRRVPPATAAERRTREAGIRAAGRDRGTMSKVADGLGKAGRSLWTLSVAISAYNVLTSDDKVKALVNEGVTLGGGLAGSALGGVVGVAALGFLVGGPVGAAIGVLAGGFAGAMGADIAFDALFEDN